MRKMHYYAVEHSPAGDPLWVWRFPSAAARDEFWREGGAVYPRRKAWAGEDRLVRQARRDGGWQESRAYPHAERASAEALGDQGGES